jgi:hypothetical protein
MGMLIWSPESILALVPDESSEQAEKPKAIANTQEAPIELAGHIFFIIKLLRGATPLQLQSIFFCDFWQIPTSFFLTFAHRAHFSIFTP